MKPREFPPADLVSLSNLMRPRYIMAFTREYHSRHAGPGSRLTYLTPEGKRRFRGPSSRPLSMSTCMFVIASSPHSSICRESASHGPGQKIRR